MKYLQRRKEIFLVLSGKDELRVSGYSDAKLQIDRQLLLTIWLGIPFEWWTGDLEEFEEKDGGWSYLWVRVHHNKQGGKGSKLVEEFYQWSCSRSDYLVTYGNFLW